MRLASSILIERRYFNFQKSKFFRTVERPILMRMDLSLEPWRICMLPHGNFNCPILKWSWVCYFEPGFASAALSRA